LPAVEASGLCSGRRAVLLGIGVAGIALVTGCDKQDASSTGSSSATTGASATAAGTPSEDAGTIEPFPSSNVPVGAILSTKEIPVGGGVLVRDELLIVQPKAGTFKAFDPRCPHQGFIVQPPRPRSTVMECPGHNSQFKAADGSLVRGPATHALSEISIKVENGYIVQV
jgi:nitrite reductase/ring-hydroxylating ferredoxin subunit